MNRALTAAALTCLLSTSALAQHKPLFDPHHAPRPAPASQATAVGTGVGIANSTSTSGAIAISGQGGAGGAGGSSSSSLTINNPANTTSTIDQRISGTTTQNINTSGTTTQNVNTSGTTTQNVNQNTNLSGTTTSNVNQSGTTTQNLNQTGGTTNTNRVINSGTTTVRAAPSMVAPGLAAAGLETCLGSASGTVSAIGFGIGGGSTYADEGCQARLDSRTLFAYGLKSAAVARLCQRADIWRSMPDVCAQYWPPGMPYPAGIVVAAPLIAPSGTYMSTSIRVIDGRDGVEKDCVNYSAAKQKCYQWAGEAPRRQRIAAITPHRPMTSKPAVKPSKPSSAVEAIETAAPTPSNK